MQCVRQQCNLPVDAGTAEIERIALPFVGHLEPFLEFPGDILDRLAGLAWRLVVGVADIDAGHGLASWCDAGIVRNPASQSKRQRGTVRFTFARKLIVCCGVENLRLHFVNRQQPDRSLHTGVHRVVREASGTLGVGDQVQGALIARICVDRRGLWLQVASGMRGVHVNGRPVQRMALLRAGDSVYLDGAELLVQASHQDVDAVPDANPAQVGDPRIVLRGVGGPYHGVSFPLSQPLLVGRARDATIRINDPAFAERHAQLELRGERVLLRDLAGGEGSTVNGVRVRDALLAAGDQVVFGPQYRFVIEIPWLSTAGGPRQESEGEDAQVPSSPAPSTPTPASTRRWPWLLVAAALMAAALSALLLFGAR